MQLTKEQEKLIEDYGTQMLKNGIKSGVKTDRKKAKTHIAKLYKEYLDREPPKEIVFVKSPSEAVKRVAKSTGVAQKDLVGEVLFINFWTWWIAYYYAGIKLLGESSGDKALDQKAIEYEAITHDLHAILPCENVCFVIEYPKTIALKDGDLDKFILHRENGLALEYTDGTGFAWLNGVEVPNWLATTPVAKLPIKKLMAETNTDVRREGFKRLGIQSTLKKLKAKILDKFRGTKKWEHYDLIEADFGDKKRRFVKMKNPSTGDYLVEQVPDTIQTVAEARAFQTRETTYVEPQVIT